MRRPCGLHALAKYGASGTVGFRLPAAAHPDDPARAFRRRQGAAPRAFGAKAEGIES